MAESSAKRRRVDDGGGGGGEVPPLLHEYGIFSAAVVNALQGYDEDMLQHITDQYTVNAQNWNGETMLMLAAYYGNVASVRFLTERGAAVNIQANDDKRTALHFARWGNSDEEFEEVLLLLLRAGADSTLKDGEGRTPREYAANEEI